MELFHALTTTTVVLLSLLVHTTTTTNTTMTTARYELGDLPVHILSGMRDSYHVDFVSNDEVTFVRHRNSSFNATVTITLDKELYVSWSNRKVTLSKEAAIWYSCSPHSFTVKLISSDQHYEIQAQGHSVYKSQWKDGPKNRLAINLYENESYDEPPLFCVVGPIQHMPTSMPLVPASTDSNELNGVVVLLTAFLVLTLALLFAAIAFIICMFRRGYVTGVMIDRLMQKSCAKEADGDVMNVSPVITPSPQQQHHHHQYQQQRISDQLRTTPTPTTQRRGANRGNGTTDADDYITANDVKPVEVAILQQESHIKGNVNYRTSSTHRSWGETSETSHRISANFAHHYAGRNEDALEDMYLDISTSAQTPQQQNVSFNKKSY